MEKGWRSHAERINYREFMAEEVTPSTKLP